MSTALAATIAARAVTGLRMSRCTSKTHEATTHSKRLADQSSAIRVHAFSSTLGLGIAFMVVMYHGYEIRAPRILPTAVRALRTAAGFNKLTPQIPGCRPSVPCQRFAELATEALPMAL